MTQQFLSIVGWSVISLLAFVANQALAAQSLGSANVKVSPKTGTTSGDSEDSHLKYFGFALIDVGWDDPTDDSNRTNYLSEVADFCNIADILAVDPSDDLRERLIEFKKQQVAAIIHLSFLFFEPVGKPSPSGSALGLRQDFRKRWDDFVELNQLKEDSESVVAFYIGEEPTWNGISANELAAACDYIKKTVPEPNVMIVEAFPSLENLVVPKSVDWVGFDHYFISDVRNSRDFQNQLATIKKLRSTDSQKIVLVPDAHFIPEVHGHFKVKRDQLTTIARDYYEIAAKDESVVALMAYFWPSGFDATGALGTRKMDEVKKVYQEIGRRITGKNAKR